MFSVEAEGDNVRVFLDGRQVLSHSREEPFAEAGKGKWLCAGGSVADSSWTPAPLVHAQYEPGRSVLRLFGGDCSLSFHLSEQAGNLVLTPQRSTTGLNRLRLSFPASHDGGVYGGGARYAGLNLRGKKWPLWVGEGRVLRRRAPSPSARMAEAGRDVTFCPIPVFFTDEGVFYSFDCACRAEFDFTGRRRHIARFWEMPSSITIGAAGEPLELMGRLTRVTGRQPLLPQWFLEGATLEVSGGASAMADALERAVRAGAVVSCLHIADWAGGFDAPGGRRPFHDWVWNRELYPRLDAILRELAGQNIRATAYVSPHLSIEGTLFASASAGGYLLKKPRGGTYISDMGGFMAGHVDLSGAEARAWFKDILRKNVLDVGFCGFFADGGNFLPPDALLSSGENPVRARGKWAALWAGLCRDVIREAGRTTDSVSFTKTGWAGIGALSMAVSTGEHHTGWDSRSGLPSALTAQLSLACSGAGLSLADCGGNVSFFTPRSKELYMRWMELAAFSPVFRVCEGDARGCGVFSDGETLAFFARMSRVHAAIGDYIRACVRENSGDGRPVMRPLFMCFPGEPSLRDRHDAYMLGGEVIVFPILGKGRKNARATLPPGNWTHLWSGRQYGPGEHVIFAPMGKPAVLYRPDGKHAALFESVTRRLM